MTCGTETGNAVYYLKKLCTVKEFEFMGIASIVMPENYIARYYVPDQVEAWEIIKRAEPYIKSAAEHIKNEKPLTGEKAPAVNGFRFKLFAFEKIKEIHTFGSNCLPSVSVESIDIFNKKLKDLKIVFPVTKIGKNWVAEFEDSEGNHIEITTPIE